METVSLPPPAHLHVGTLLFVPLDHHLHTLILLLSHALWLQTYISHSIPYLSLKDLLLLFCHPLLYNMPTHSYLVVDCFGFCANLKLQLQFLGTLHPILVRLYPFVQYFVDEKKEGCKNFVDLRVTFMWILINVVVRQVYSGII